MNETDIAGQVLTRMPAESSFIRGVLTSPEDVGLWGIYADYLEEHGEARGEALRIKWNLTSIPADDPRREELRARLEQVRPNLDPEWFALVIRFGPAALCPIGCPTTDLAEVPQRLVASGLPVRPPGVVRDGDHLVFCISCPDGPMPGTLEAVTRCAGRTVAPVAIVLTRAEAVDNDSLRDLVTLEERELLSRVIPRQEVERLPLYYDFDPGLVRKLLLRIYEGPGMITCGSG